MANTSPSRLLLNIGIRLTCSFVLLLFMYSKYSFAAWLLVQRHLVSSWRFSSFCSLASLFTLYWMDIKPLNALDFYKGTRQKNYLQLQWNYLLYYIHKYKCLLYKYCILLSTTIRVFMVDNTGEKGNVRVSVISPRILFIALFNCWKLTGENPIVKL